MKSKALIIIPVTILLIVSGILSLYFYKETEKVNNFLIGDKKSAVLEQVASQELINKKLDSIASEKKYTFNDPYVELDPYGISPLSAIIIFNTAKSAEVKVYINDVFVTTMEEAKKHIIPIYGLKEDTENVVKLVMDEEEHITKIKTKKSNIEYPLNVKYKSASLNNEELYFTVASYKTYLTAWDIDGNLRFYLTVDNRMDVEWLDNGHFLIGTSQGQFAENFVAFVEMDYLGKIYNYYVPEHGSSFEFQVLNDGNYMLAGGNKPVYIDEQVIYTINKSDGKTKDLINLAEAILEIDPNFDKAYLGQKAIRNSFYYDEANDNLLVSFRGMDAVLSFSFKNKKLNWVFTDPSNELFANTVWQKYLVISRTGRYPLGQHSVIITHSGNIAYFNNGYNRLHGFENGGNDLVSYYKDNYSSVDIYRINDGVATLSWKYDANKELFSHQYGSVRELSNGNILMNFGYNLKNEYRKSAGTLSAAEANPENIFAEIIETDSSKNVVFNATCEEGKFRVFKHGQYTSETPNISVKTLNKYNVVEKDNITVSNHNDAKLESAKEWIYTSTLTQNTFTTSYEIKDTDEIDLYFVNKTGKVYILNYKAKDNFNKNRIFHVDLVNGEYALYIKVNDTVYKTNTVYKF